MFISSSCNFLSFYSYCVETEVYYLKKKNRHNEEEKEHLANQSEEKCIL